MTKLMDFLRTIRDFWNLHPHLATIALSIVLVFFIALLR